MENQGGFGKGMPGPPPGRQGPGGCGPPMGPGPAMGGGQYGGPPMGGGQYGGGHHMDQGAYRQGGGNPQYDHQGSYMQGGGQGGGQGGYTQVGGGDHGAYMQGRGDPGYMQGGGGCQGGYMGGDQYMQGGGGDRGYMQGGGDQGYMQGGMGGRHDQQQPYHQGGPGQYGAPPGGQPQHYNDRGPRGCPGPMQQGGGCRGGYDHGGKGYDSGGMGGGYNQGGKGGGYDNGGMGGGFDGGKRGAYDHGKGGYEAGGMGGGYDGGKGGGYDNGGKGGSYDSGKGGGYDTGGKGGFDAGGMGGGFDGGMGGSYEGGKGGGYGPGSGMAGGYDGGKGGGYDAASGGGFEAPGGKGGGMPPPSGPPRNNFTPVSRGGKGGGSGPGGAPGGGPGGGPSGGGQGPTGGKGVPAPSHEIVAGRQPSGGTTQQATTGTLAMKGSSSGNSNRSSNRLSNRGVRFGEGSNDRDQGRNQIERGEMRREIQPSASTVEQLEPFNQAMDQELEQQVSDVLAQIQSACQAAVPSGEQLMPVGAYYFGVLKAGDEVDVVYPIPPDQQMNTAIPAVKQQLQATSNVELISELGPDGLLKAPGYRVVMNTGLVVKVMIAQRISGLPEPRPEAIVQKTAGILARETSACILNSVPNQSQFRSLLRFVRNWAMERGVYGRNGHFGFFSGTAWAICCARVCQSNPNLELAQLLSRFFRMISRWDWRHPVTIPKTNSEEQPAAANPSLGVGGVVSTGRGVSVTGHPLVLLPVGQDISAVPHASETILQIIQKELRRGYKLTQQVQLGRSPVTEMYAPSRFFRRHRHYLQFDFMARSPEVLESWLVWGRQQMADSVKVFEEMSANVVTLRPWPTEIEFKDAEWACSKAMLVGLHLERDAEGADGAPRRSFDLREPIVKLLEAVSSWPEAEANRGRFEMMIRHVRQAELEQWMENQSQGCIQFATDGMSQLPNTDKLESGGNLAEDDYEHASL